MFVIKESVIKAQFNNKDAVFFHLFLFPDLTVEKLVDFLTRSFGRYSMFVNKELVTKS